MDKIIDDIARNIKKYRKLNKMTQRDLAERVGVSIAAVSNWETGSNSIDIDILFKVCDVLGVPISVMTSSETNNDYFTREEKAIIYNFRSAAPLDQYVILKLLNMIPKDIDENISQYISHTLSHWSDI